MEIDRRSLGDHYEIARKSRLLHPRRPRALAVTVSPSPYACTWRSPRCISPYLPISAGGDRGAAAARARVAGQPPRDAPRPPEPSPTTDHLLLTYDLRLTTYLLTYYLLLTTDYRAGDAPGHQAGQRAAHRRGHARAHRLLSRQGAARAPAPARAPPLAPLSRQGCRGIGRAGCCISIYIPTISPISPHYLPYTSPISPRLSRRRPSSLRQPRAPRVRLRRGRLRRGRGRSASTTRAARRTRAAPRCTPRPYGHPNPNA